MKRVKFHLEAYYKELEEILLEDYYYLLFRRNLIQVKI